jgi:hypothetical protein
MKSIAFLATLAACGSAPAAPDAATCTLALAGNFDEASSAPADCPTVAGGELDFTLPSSAIGSPIAVAIELGAAPATGTYSSETIAHWRLVAARSVGVDGACVYSAGDEVTPHGSFTLVLTSIDASAAHGTLDAILWVHALDSTDCGAGDTETVHVSF